LRQTFTPAATSERPQVALTGSSHPRLSDRARCARSLLQDRDRRSGLVLPDGDASGMVCRLAKGLHVASKRSDEEVLEFSQSVPKTIHAHGPTSSGSGWRQLPKRLIRFSGPASHVAATSATTGFVNSSRKSSRPRTAFGKRSRLTRWSIAAAAG